MQRYREREETFDVDDGFSVSSLADRLASLGVHLEPAKHALLRATYYDTADLRLLHNHITLRRRAGGSDAGWHLKLPAGQPGDRIELRLPLSAGRNAVPSELVDLLTAYLRGAPLRPVLIIDTDRNASVVRANGGEDGGGETGGGEALLEVADDHVVAERLGDHAVRTWREIEVERLGDSAALAEKLARLLRQAGARPAATVSKAARALEIDDRLSGAAPSSARKARRVDLLALRLRQLVGDLAREDLHLRQGAPEAIHDLRVAVRRLRSLLRTFSSLFEPEPAAELAGELSFLGDLLGDARDKEVLAARTERDLAQVAPEERLGPVRAGLAGQLVGEAAAARQSLLGALGSTRYQALLERLDRFATTPPYRPGAGGRDGPELRRCVRKEVSRVRRRVAEAQRAAPAGREAAFHRARKAAKRARYAGETLLPVEPKRAKRLARAFEAVQEILGERHDAAVAHDIYAREGAKAGVRPGENGYTYGVLAERERRAVEDAGVAFERVWRKADRASLRRFLD